ncbi:MAG: hypothetical protein LC687_08165, partial [Actinobacteria bacterium]|nr:hypothetical protein [Actinomycetota bacterium]
DEDVLARFALAAQHYEVDRVIRVTADNPAVSYTLARSLTRKARLEPYLTHQDVVKGLGSELISTEALLTAHNKATLPNHREHVSPYIKDSIGMRILFPPVACYPIILNANLSIDTQEDYERMSKLFDEVFKGKPLKIETVMEWSSRQWLYMDNP